jgi:hypothetical protein
MFIHTLPILFAQMRLISPFEALFMLLGVFIVVFLTSPAAEGCHRSRTEKYLFAAWVGLLPLRSVFWPFFLLLNGMLYGLDVLAKTGNFTVSSWDDVHFILLFPIIWWTASVWRCSANTDLRFWGASARLMTICVFLEYALKLTIRIDYPRLFFNCEDLLLDYGSCF